MKRVLLVEDEAPIREMIAINLIHAGYEVTEAESAEQAVELYEQAKGDFCIALLDIMLPGMSGFSLCEKIRAENDRIGIIILSAKTQEQDKVTGLTIGADDYITKPFSVSELLARVDALYRRSAKTETETVNGAVISGAFSLNTRSRTLTKNSTEIDLTQVEFQIMELFFENQGAALNRETILEKVWGDNYYGDIKIVDVNIRRLRMKIEDDPSNPKNIITVWGYGYRWNAQK